MNNFCILYRYELKKLLKRKLAWFMTFLLAALIAYDACPDNMSRGDDFSLMDRDGNTVSKYISAAEQEKLVFEGGQRICGEVMDELFFQNVREASVGNGIYFIQDYSDLESYFFLVDSSYYEPYLLTEYYMGLDSTKITAEQFYAQRQETINSQWENLTNGERVYWEVMETQIEKPFVYRYISGYQNFLSDIFGLSNVIPLAAAICLCGVFSEEKRAQTDALIFSSKQGRFPQYLAKVLAGITVVLVATLLVIAADAVTILLTRGWSGFGAALQLEHMMSCLPIVMGESVLIFFGLLLLYGLLCGGITMLVSAFTQNTIAALATPILLMIGQAWLRADIQAMEYLPNQLFNTINSLSNMNLINIFGRYLNNLQFSFILYGGLAAALLALCWLGWRRSAAGKV